MCPLCLQMRKMILTFNYISEHVFNVLDGDWITNLKAMAIIWISDHPMQCKVGGLNSGGYSSCQCIFHASRW
jgi:hypothetical protein